MIKSIGVINPSGELLTLELRSPEKSGFFIESIDGLGPVKSNINISQSLWQDGGKFNSARSGSRNLVIKLGLLEGTPESIEDLRLKAYRYFPNKKPVTIEVLTDNRHATTIGYVEGNEPDIFSREEKVQISLICPDPYFYDTEFITTVFHGIASGFEFPFENQSTTLSLLEFGSVFLNDQANVFNSGDISTGIFVIIQFTGAVTDPTINNLSNGQSMVFSSSRLTTLTGFNFKANDVLLVSTIRGSKQIVLVRDGIGINVLNIMTTVNGWITIDKGDNVMAYTATSGLANMLVSVQHQVVYEGM
jgi:Phage tail protein